DARRRPRRGRPARPSARGAVRRPAAADRDRPRPDHRAGSALRRRAHREPGQRHVGGGAPAAAAVGAGAGADRRDGHPRAGGGAVRRRRGDHAGRADRLMRTVFLASLRTYIRRYVAAAIAVTVAVSFVVVVGVLTSGAINGLMGGLGRRTAMPTRWSRLPGGRRPTWTRRP